MPSRLSRQIARIRSDIQNLIDSGVHDRSALVSLLRRIAPLVAEALDDLEHPIQEELENLRSTIQNIELTRQQSQEDPVDSSSHASNSRTTGRRSLSPDRRLRNICFVPQPGANQRELRQHWRTQLLLLVGMGNECGVERLAQLMEEEASDLRHAAQRGAETTTHHWNPATYLQRLQQAISLLDWEGPPIRLEGRTLRQGDNPVKLSPQESQLLECLRDSFDEWVDPARLQRAGVTNPVKIKYHLTKKLAKADIPLTILRDGGRYMLAGADIRGPVRRTTRTQRVKSARPKKRAKRRGHVRLPRSSGLAN